MMSFIVCLVVGLALPVRFGVHANGNAIFLLRRTLAKFINKSSLFILSHRMATSLS